MALPDINTDEVGWIAFWNHLDNGASNINPTTAGSALDNYSEYSNGIEGEKTVTYSLANDRKIRARVKDDGWLVCWLDRYEEENLSVGDGSGVRGPWSALDDWAKNQRDYPITWDGSGDNHLLDTLASLHNNLDTSGGATFNRSDVGQFHYLAPGASTLTHFNGGVGDDGTYGFTPSSTVDLSKCWVSATHDGGAGSPVTWDYGVANVAMTSQYDQVGTREAVSAGEVVAGERTDTQITYVENVTNVQLLWS